MCSLHGYCLMQPCSLLNAGLMKIHLDNFDRELDKLNVA